MKSAVSGAVWPAWGRRFRSDDLDEIRTHIDQDVGPHVRVTHQPGPVGFDMWSCSGQAITVGWGTVGVGQTVRGRNHHPVLHVDPPVGTVYRLGRQVLSPTEAGSITLVAAGCEFTRTSAAGPMCAIQVHGEVLAAEIGARLDRTSVEWTCSTKRLRLNDAQRQDLLLDAQRYAQALAPGVPSKHAAFSASRLISRVAQAVLADGAVHPVVAMSNRRLQALEAWIDANLDSPISLGKLCAQAGVGERCLQKTFETQRGMSPLRFVTERRLHAARRHLVATGPAHSVTRVALDLGFGHLGRFAVQYRELFGESPSQTKHQGTRRSLCG